MVIGDCSLGGGGRQSLKTTQLLREVGAFQTVTIARPFTAIFVIA